MLRAITAGLIALTCICFAESKSPTVSVVKPQFQSNDIEHFLTEEFKVSKQEGTVQYHFDFRPMAPLRKNYHVAGPLTLHLRQHTETGKLQLVCWDELHGIEDRNDTVFSDVYFGTAVSKKKIPGKKVVYSNGVGWLSEDIIHLNDGDTVKGVITTKVAVEKYIIENVHKGMTLKTHGLNIQLKKYDGQPRILSPLGHYGLWEVTEENKDRMWYVLVEVLNSMSSEDAAFVKKIQEDYFKGSTPHGKIRSRYVQLKRKTPTVQVHDIWRMPSRQICVKCIEGTHETEREKELCLLERGISHEVAFQIDKSEIGFDCVQDGNDVFPVGLEITKYESRDLEFEIVYQGTGLKKLSDSDKPEPYEVRENDIGMQFVWIPAGSFLMGSKLSPAEISEKYGGAEVNFENEYPQHKVVISKGFWVGRYEVTQLQYKTIMGNNPSNFRYQCPHCEKFLDMTYTKEDVLKDKGANHPVETVSWKKAVEFCEKLSKKDNLTYTLPTEAQWEYACRAGTTSPYFFGDDSTKLEEYAWFEENAGEATHPVGEKLPNPWGLYDMYGNTAEWCLDWYDPEYYSKSETTDPYNDDQGGGKYRLHSVRGGDIIFDDEYLRSASRDYSFEKFEPMCTNGLRVICKPKE